MERKSKSDQFEKAIFKENGNLCVDWNVKKVGPSSRGKEGFREISLHLLSISENNRKENSDD